MDLYNEAEIQMTLRLSAGQADEDVALLSACYIENFTQFPVTGLTVAAIMRILANREVSDERAEQLLENLGEQDFIEELT